MFNFLLFSILYGNVFWYRVLLHLGNLIFSGVVWRSRRVKTISVILSKAGIEPALLFPPKSLNESLGNPLRQRKLSQATPHPSPRFFRLRVAASIFFKGREREAASSTILSGNKSAGYMGALIQTNRQRTGTSQQNQL